MSSEDPALQPPVLEPWWDGYGEGHPHPGMFKTDQSLTQSRRNASVIFFVQLYLLYAANMNMNLFNHNNNSTDNYDIVQLNSCGC